MEATDMKARDGVRLQMQAIFDREGSVRPGELVDACRPEDAPGHHGFEWDDWVAAEAHRRAEARRWIRVVPIVSEGEDQRLIHVPVRITEDGEGREEGCYRPLNLLVRDHDAFDRSLAALKAQASALGRSMRELERAAKANGSPVQKRTARKVARGAAIIDAALRVP